MAFRDVRPVAKTHFLVIPKNRAGLTGLRKASKSHITLLGHLMWVAATVANQEKLEEGYRLIVNDGPHAGKSNSLWKRS